MLEERVSQWEERLLPRGAEVLVGVSGGPDSMALLHRLWSTAAERGWNVTAVHVDHGLRGEESAEDARHVQAWCQQQGIPCYVERVDVGSYVNKHGENKQAAARKLRYDAFSSVAKRVGATYLALAHHGDDQVETLLMRLVRGTGIQGLTGIPHRRRWREIWIVRPWLEVSRAEILTYCTTHGIPFRRDASNEDPVYTRNRVRQELVPMLSTFNPRFHEVLLQLRALAADEEQVWERLTKEAFQQVCTRVDEKGITVDVNRLIGLEVALQRRVIKLILNCLVKKSANEVDLQTVERVRALAAGESPSARTPLPGGGWVRRQYHLLRFFPYGEKMETAAVPAPVSLQLPGETLWGGGKICARFEEEQISVSGWGRETAVFDRDRLPPFLSVRTRLPGDRMRPLGLDGSKKVKDLFIDAKIPQDQRDGIPLITAGNDIIWIPGVARSDIALCDADTRRTLVLRWVPDVGAR